jgi:hypothetical protein
MRGFSNSIRDAEASHPGLLPDIRQGSTIFVASDYGGQTSLAQYESLCFLLADLERCGHWERLREELRRHFLPDGRRMSYKDLNDKRRRRALLPFLNAANTIPGLLVTILIDKSIESLFKATGNLSMDEPSLQQYSHWNSFVFEKLLRIIHFASFFLAGLSRPYQNVLWITDEDDIVPNEQRLREAVNIFANVSSLYLKHKLGHFRWGTTKSDTGTRQLEDLVSVTDLVAGSLLEDLTSYRKEKIFPQSKLVVPPPENLKRKTREVTDWFADNTKSLRRLVYVIEPVEGSTTLNLKHLRFWGSRDLAAY